MKNRHRFSTLVFAAPLTLAVLLGAGCQKTENTAAPAPAPAPAPKATSAAAEKPSAEKNSFEEVTSKLDRGGSLYVYLSTERWLDGLSANIGKARGILDSLPNMNGTDKENVLRVFDVVTNLVKASGIEDVSGFGMSSIAREPGLYHTKFVLHHYQGKGAGYLWSLFGTKPHALDALNWLPDTTVFTIFSDFDLSVLTSAIDAQIDKLGIPDARAKLEEGKAQFAAATGLKLDEVIASLGNEYGVAITLDDSKTITLPLGAKQVNLPEPGLSIALKVKSDLIFDRVDQLLKDNPMVVKSEKDGAKLRTFQLPLPFPWLRPTLARVGDYLFVGSSDAMLSDFMEVKAGKKAGIKSTAEFKKLSAETPEEGNGFAFVSKRFGDAVKKIQTDLMADNPARDQIKMFQDLFNSKGGDNVYAVRVVGEDGIVSSMNGSQDESKVVLLVPVAAVGVAAGLALPAIAKAKAAAQHHAESQ